MPDPLPDWGSTLTLLTRARAGDQQALNDLFARYIPPLQRWASGRLPHWARDLAETQDVVQESLVQAFKGMDRFEHRGEGSLQAYLRQAVMNRIRDELRRVRRRPVPVDLQEDLEDSAISPLEAAIGVEAVEHYEAALGRLRPVERELIIARVELGLTYSELAEAMGKPSASAARMAVARALVRLAEEMSGTGGVAD